MKPILKFDILHNYDPKTLLIADSSMWAHIELKPAIIEITTPGSNNAIVHYFKKGQINIFNSINLMLNCQLPCGCESTDYYDLPDGFYTITLKGSPDTFCYETTHFQSAKARLSLDQMYANLNLNCDRLNEDKARMIREAEFLLSAAEANTRLSNIQTAQELFYKAQSLINKSQNVKNCY